MLRLETQVLWDTLKEEKALGGFTLIGGTALSLHIGHRLSEDLDFAFREGKLPRHRISALLRILQAKGFELIANDSPQALREFEDTGLDLLDYQQNFMSTSGVKVTFLAPDREILAQLDPADDDRVRVASLNEIFKLKCIACANRSKTRDWLDMYTLLQQGHFDATDMRAPFDAAKAPQKLHIALTRLCSGQPDPDDEGYASLLADPPTIEQMQGYFCEQRSRIEVDAAKRLRSQTPGG